MAYTKNFFSNNPLATANNSYNFEESLAVDLKMQNVIDQSTDFISSKEISESELIASNHREPIILVTSALTKLAPAQSGSTVVLSRAAGADIVLPAASTGLSYTFYVETTLTSGSYTITAQDGDLLLGGVLSIDDTTPEAAVIFRPDGSNDFIITMNGSTTGGELGTAITLTALSASSWYVTGSIAANGILVTPFS